MSDAPGTPDVDAPVPADEGLPLPLVERQLAPIRRLVAYATEHPDRARYVEANLRRWLGPLLEANLPEPFRDVLIALAGAIAGIDTLDPADRTLRLRPIRQEIARLDAVLGLPLPRRDRPRPTRPRRSARTEAPPQEEPRERRGRRGRGRRRGSASREERREEPPAPRPRVPEPRQPFWSGNPYQEVKTLPIEPSLADALLTAGISTVADLLHLRPTDQEILRPIHGAGRPLPQGRIAVGGRLAGRHTVLRNTSREARATLVGADRLTLTWSDPADADRALDGVSQGERVVVVGEERDGRLHEPTAVVEDGKEVRLVHYGLPGVADDAVQRLLFRLLPGFAQVRDPLPNAIRPDGLIAHGQALLALHARGDRKAAQRRLAYEEALGVSLGAAWPSTAQRRRGIQQTVLHRAVSVIQTHLDGHLSDSAEQAFDDIRRDLRRNRPMRRVLAGPPGGNKGLTALLAAAAVAEGKSQVLWVGATAQHAEALYAFSAPLLAVAGLKAELLRPGRKPSAQLRDQLKRGEIHVLFTAPDPVDSSLEFRRLGLVISSERHGRVGLGGARVEELGPPFPDLLVVAGTRPTAAELLGPWGDFGVSWVDGPPAPTAVVKTVSQRDSAYAAARTTLVSGGQVAVLFPQINGTDALDPTEASRVMSAISEEALSGAKMTLLHGAMPAADRRQTVADMSHRRAEALLSTVPLEDLAPIPGIDVVVVEHAQRMEPLRLGRIAGMGVRQVSLVVADDTPADQVEALLESLAGPTADHDTGIQFAFFDPRHDTDLLVDARRAALELLSVDGSLRNGAHADLVRLVRTRWRVWMGADAPCPLPDVGEGGSQKRRRRRRRRR
jgi:ATP-dependent DNA helicase RecG